MRRFFGACAVLLLLTSSALWAAGSEVADAVMKRNIAALRSLLQQKANVNTPQIDGTTALHWAAQFGDLDSADLLIRAGANVSAAKKMKKK